MPRVKLVNSAMMPSEGTYKLRRITKNLFIRILRRASERGIVDSTIGYPNVIDLLFKWTGISFPVSREQTTLEDGDIMLITKLKYRVQDPSTKGKYVPSEDDYEFFIATYKK